MYCIHCGEALAENARFCSRCGKPVDVIRGQSASETAGVAESAGDGKIVNEQPRVVQGGNEADSAQQSVSVVPVGEDSAAVQETAATLQEAANAVGSVVAGGAQTDRPVRKSRSLLKYLLSFVLFLGMFSGTWLAYVVAKNGWIAIPFADKLAYLPFVAIQDEADKKQGLYTVQQETEPEEEDKDKPEDDLDREAADGAESSGEFAMAPDADMSASDLPDSGTVEPAGTTREVWVGYQDSYTKLFLYFVDETEVLGFGHQSDEAGAIVRAEAFSDYYSVVEGRIVVDGEPIATFDETGETLVFEWMEPHLTFHRTDVEVGLLVGTWEAIDGTSDLRLDFDPESLTGFISHGTDPDTRHAITYRFDAETGQLTMIMDGQGGISLNYRVHVIDDFLILQDDDEEVPILLKRT